MRLAASSGLQNLSNAEVAAELFVSRKAVEYHLSNIYAKCGLRGRQKLRRFVADWRQPVAPDPAHFDAFADKTATLVHGFGGWSDGQIRDIEVPVLVLIGDTDFILVPNAAEAAALLPHGQLAVLPGTTHIDLTRSELVPAVVETFLRR